MSVALLVEKADNHTVPQTGIRGIERFVDDVLGFDTPHRRHGGVRRPVGEDDTARLLLEQIPYVLIALLTETLDRLPRIDVLKSNLIDEKVVFPDDVEHDLTLTKPLVEQSLNNLRRVHVAVCDRVQNQIVLQSFCQIPRL